ncbi:MAG: hypothetical protein JST00_05480 [Deltaproteobacteria bacterium]|nr:hypothetical protein [Deltaproteobacteria bacterium]
MRRLLVSAALLVGLLGTSHASATDVQACVASSEKAQKLRAAGKLREARDQLQICASDTCPALVRRDCVQWQSEVAASLPTVVFGAKDRQGRDLFDVTVSMDGDVLVKRLDGKAIAVDPGPHTFRFDATGASPVVQRVLVKEGERARVIDVSIAEASENAGGAAHPPPAPAKAEAPVATSSSGGHTAFPWILGGVGAATLVFGVVWLAGTPKLPDGCNSETKTCLRVANETPSEYTERQQTAGRSDGQPREAALFMGIGGTLLIGGIVWYLLEPSGSKASAVRATPWTSASGGGLALDGSF